MSYISLMRATVLFAAATWAVPCSAELWEDATSATLGATAQWTNKVELADIDGDGWVDILFANGRGYSTPGGGEANRVFINPQGTGAWAEATSEVMGDVLDQTRAIKVRDYRHDGSVGIFVANTYQSQSRLIFRKDDGTFEDASTTHLPQATHSFGDAEPGDVDGDGDLDLVLADWGAGNALSNSGGRTRLWLNDGAGHFTDATAAQMPDILVRFSWELELVDVDNDYDLDVLVSCKACPGSYVFRNDGSGSFASMSLGLPQFSNNYEIEAMHVDGDEFLDLVTINDGPNLTEHLFLGTSIGGFIDATASWWGNTSNVGKDDNVAKFLDADSDSDADFIIGSLSGADRLLTNKSGKLTLDSTILSGPPTPGTLDIALADLNQDRRIDLVMAQGESGNESDRLYWGVDVAPDTAPAFVGPARAWVGSATSAGGPTEGDDSSTVWVQARVHDRKSSILHSDFAAVYAEMMGNGPEGASTAPARLYGEYLWIASTPAAGTSVNKARMCAQDAALTGTVCSDWVDVEGIPTPPVEADDAEQDGTGDDGGEVNGVESEQDTAAAEVDEPDSAPADGITAADTASDAEDGPDSAEADSTGGDTAPTGDAPQVDSGEGDTPPWSSPDGSPFDAGVGADGVGDAEPENDGAPSTPASGTSAGGDGGCAARAGGRVALPASWCLMLLMCGLHFTKGRRRAPRSYTRPRGA